MGVVVKISNHKSEKVKDTDSSGFAFSVRKERLDLDSP